MTSRQWTLLMVIFGLFIGLGHAQNLAEKYRSNAEKLQFLEKALNGWDKITRWRIEYEAAVSDLTPRVSGAHRIVAVAGPGALFHMGASFVGTNAWSLDPFRQEYFISNGMTCHRWPFNRIYSLSSLAKGEAVPGSLAQEPVLSIVPSWPLSDFRLAAGDEQITPVQAVRAQDYKLWRNMEKIGSTSCLVFEGPANNRLWVAADIGFCVMKRERWDSLSKRLIDRVLVQKIREVTPGLWLPWDFRYQLFSGSSSSNRDTLEADYQVHILSCELGSNVPATIFLPSYRPGELEYRSDGRFSQTVAGGEDLLAEMATYASNASIHSSSGFRARAAGTYGYPLIAFAIGICLGAWRMVYRGKRERAPSSRMAYKSSQLGGLQ